MKLINGAYVPNITTSSNMSPFSPPQGNITTDNLTYIQGVLVDLVNKHDQYILTYDESNDLLVMAAPHDVEGNSLQESDVANLVSDLSAKASASSLASHVSATTGIHGVTGSIVGTTDTQTLTNKTITGTFTGPLTGNVSGTAGGLSANIAESKVTNLVSDLSAKLNLSGGTMTGDLDLGSNQLSNVDTLTCSGLIYDAGSITSGGISFDNGAISTDGSGGMTLGNGSVQLNTHQSTFDYGLVYTNGDGILTASSFICDNGAITTDGSGNLTVKSLSLNGSAGVLDVGFNSLISSSGVLVVGSPIQLDNGAITTDGSGNIEMDGYIIDAGSKWSINWNGQGEVKFDDGNITSDGSGRVTVVDIETSNINYINSNDLTIWTAVTITGPTTLDGGEITTDGSGNLNVTGGEGISSNGGYNVNNFSDTVIDPSGNFWASGQIVIDANTANASFATLNLANLPTSASGLSSGDVWNNGGVLTIV